MSTDSVCFRDLRGPPLLVDHVSGLEGRRSSSPSSRRQVSWLLCLILIPLESAKMGEASVFIDACFHKSERKQSNDFYVTT